VTSLVYEASLKVETLNLVNEHTSSYIGIMVYIESETKGFHLVKSHNEVPKNSRCFAVLPCRPEVYSRVVWETPLYDTGTFFRKGEYKMVHPGGWIRED